MKVFAIGSQTDMREAALKIPQEFLYPYFSGKFKRAYIDSLGIIHIETNGRKAKINLYREFTHQQIKSFEVQK